MEPLRETEEIEKAIRKGKNEILVLFGAALLVSLTIIIARNVLVSQGNLFAQTARTLATIVVMYFTYRGSKVAKWILTAIYVFGAVSMLYENGLSILFYNNFLPYLLVFYLFFAVYLQFSKSINLFLEYQNTKYAPDKNSIPEKSKTL